MEFGKHQVSQGKVFSKEKKIFVGQNMLKQWSWHAKKKINHWDSTRFTGQGWMESALIQFEIPGSA